MPDRKRSAITWQALDLLGRLPPTAERHRVHAEAVYELLQLPGWLRSPAEQTSGFQHLDAALAWVAENGTMATRARLEARKGTMLHDEALLRQALTRAEAAGDTAAMAAVADEYGGYLGQEGRYEETLVQVARAVKFYGALGDQYRQAMAMAGNGRCYSCRAGRFDEAFRYATRVREVAEELADARLRAWRAMEAEPFMYQGAWADVVRVAEAALPGAWEIAEINPILFASGWLGSATSSSAGATMLGAWSIGRCARGEPGWESPGSCSSRACPGPAASVARGSGRSSRGGSAGTPTRRAHPLPPRAGSSAPSPR